MKSLLSLVIDETKHGEAAWKWLLETIRLFETRSEFHTWQIAHALLLAQSTRWHICDWRARVEGLRTWQHDHACALTRSVVTPQALCALMSMITEHGKHLLPACLSTLMQNVGSVEIGYYVSKNATSRIRSIQAGGYSLLGQRSIVF